MRQSTCFAANERGSVPPGRKLSSPFVRGICSATGIVLIARRNPISLTCAFESERLLGVRQSSAPAPRFHFRLQRISPTCGEGGFDLIVGNLRGWRIPQIPNLRKRKLRREFEVYRNAAWEAGAAAAGAGRGLRA